MEYLLLNVLGKDVPTCDYLFTYVLSFAIFVFALQFPNFTFCKLDLVGREYSLWIYVLHMNLYGVITRLTSLLPVKQAVIVLLIQVTAAYFISVIIGYIVKKCFNACSKYIHIGIVP